MMDLIFQIVGMILVDHAGASGVDGGDSHIGGDIHGHFRIVSLTQIQMVPLFRGAVFTGENCSAEKRNHLDLRQRDYAEMAMDVAAYVGIPSIDAGSTSMINQYHTDYLKDQIHHTDLGGQQYALTVWLELKDMAPLLKAE